MTNKINADEIEQFLRESRIKTREMLDLVIDEKDLRRSPGEGFRPILWHLGHVGAFEGYWILQRLKGDPPISRRYDEIFDPIKTPRDDSTNLPPIQEIEDYLARVREEVLAFIFSNRARQSTYTYILDMVIEHEYQHQETIAYLMHMLDPHLKRRPSTADEHFVGEASDTSGSALGEMVSVEGGPFEMGSIGNYFSYDNERPLQIVELGGFRIDRFPVTNGEYAQFIEAGGYNQRSFWSDEGWEWKEQNQIARPLYWTGAGADGTERVRGMFEESAIKPRHPVTGVSFYEASAYARFAGKRLPTEAEWEKASSWNPRTRSKQRFSWGDQDADRKLANFNTHNWGTTSVKAFPGGRSPYGCYDMTGNVWEWTSSVFGPYKGFEAFPYKEYSELWFDGDHRVMKGGSWATRGRLLRSSFRNFFRPPTRFAFAGFRCAADL